MPEAERPRPSDTNTLFGSDAVADVLRALDIAFIALNPGASYRGLHDSLVNHLGNVRPQLLMCLHENHAVALAHGYAKVTGRAMAVALHSNVGLMNGSMGIFNAWCDRMPILVIGATGPVDAAKRRPWIDWIHTARDQGALVRHYVKWDDQPASPAAAREAIQRATWLANTTPKAPVYINLDAGMQEEALAEPLPAVDPARFMPAARPGVSREMAEQAAAMLTGARAPLILMGRVKREAASWRARVALAEALGARVVTDGKLGAAFPTDHPLHVGTEGKAAVAAVRDADVVLSLDWVDLAGMLGMAFRGAAVTAKVVHASMDHQIHNGWSMDHQGLPIVDLLLPAEVDDVVGALLDALPQSTAPPDYPMPEPPPAFVADGTPITVPRLARALRTALGGRETALFRVPGGWDEAEWPLHGPEDYFGSIGGAGLGGTPGIAIGGALALKVSGSSRLPVAVNGDGDFLMGATALWTAAHYRIPLLYVIANNRSYFGDERHQAQVATARGRNVENKHIGLRIDDPEIDIAKLAEAQGVVGLGPVTRDRDLLPMFEQAIAEVERGRCVVVDVHTTP